MKMYTKDGLELMDLKSFGLLGDALEMKGKMMGSMNMTVLMKPEDLWSAYQMMPWRVLIRMPCMLFKGWLVSRRSATTAKQA